MSGHSKWAKIHRKKGVTDAQRGKVFSKHSKLITIAAKSGPDPELNPSLAMAISNAKKTNMPGSNIDKAIRTGAGLDKDAAQIESILFEGHGPNGIPVLISALTDNRNRATAEIRHALSKSGGNLGTSGSAAFQFDQKGEIIFKTAAKSEDQIMEAVLSAGADDFDFDPDESSALTNPTNLHQVKTKLEAQNFDIQSAIITWQPKNPTQITDPNQAQKILNLMSTLDDLDDVNEVTGAFDIPDQILTQLS